jgi:hypothetical protein
MSKISTIRNLGPKMETLLGSAGIRTAEEVHELGVKEVYRRLLLAGRRPHFIAYYSIYLGLQGRPWNDMTPEEKASVRADFDRIAAEVSIGRGEDSRIEKELDILGVRRPGKP